MNYKPLLNKDTKFGNMFKNKNHYRFKNKKKTGSKFVFFSIVSIGFFTILANIGIDSDKKITRQNFEQLSKNTISDTSYQNKNIPLDLPEIGYRSEVLSPLVTYSEVKIPAATISETQPVTTIAAKTEPLKSKHLESAIALSAPELLEKNSTVKEVTGDDKSVNSAINSNDLVNITPSPTTPQELNKNVTSSVLKKVGASKPISENGSVFSKNKQSTSSPLSNTKTVIVKSGDSLSAIFKRLSLSAGTLHQIINSGKQAKKLARIKPGQKLVIQYDDSNEFQSLHYALDSIDTLVITKDDAQSKYLSHIDSKEIEIRHQFAAGTITNSLFSAGNKAGLNSAMIMKLAQLFGWDVDFALDIRKGDSFAVLFEEKYINNKKIANGNILSAEFVNRGKTFKAIRYTDASGHTDYYSEKGLSMRKAFLRTPVAFSRISSRFSNGRKHPVLNKIRAHKGVDYAASRGTSIKSVGDGKVIFKGRKGGYGRVIILQHGSKYTTLYAHMNSYNRKIKRGGRVKQGQIIGYVGSSGLATGPHLHYEFRINGVHRNPLTVPLPSASPIARKYRADFQSIADTLISQLKTRKLETVALKEQ